MAQNPVIEKLVKGAVERCRERIAAVRDGGGAIHTWQQTRKTGITLTLKRSHGL